MKISGIPDDHLQMLLNTPHQIYLVDDVLSKKITGFKSEITFGNINPAGIPQTAVSITLSTNDLYRIAKDIVAEIEGKKSEISDQQIQFTSELNK